MVDDPFIDNDELHIRAGEYALGVLEGDELSEAKRAMLSNPEFAEAVDWWNRQLGVIAETVPAYEPSVATWQAIEARLDGAQDRESEPAQIADRRGPAPLSIATALAGVAAAIGALILFVSTPETVPVAGPTSPEVTGERLVAQLIDEETSRKLVGVVDVGKNNLSLNVAGLDAEAGLSPELWVIPADGVPVSLGSIPETGQFARDLSEREAALLTQGASLAVTFEEATGLPHEAPTPPILLVGALNAV